MATITKGKTFTNGELVTPQKIHELVDLGTVSNIVNADIAASASIADTKLATIATAGKVSNSATTATSANTANAIVARDASGNFSAGTITAALSGNASSATTAAACTGNAATATTLQTARTINGVSFNGSANITVTAAPNAHTHAISDTTGLQTALDGKQAALGFTPVQQGGGANQTTNKLYMGWSGTSQLRLQIDSTDFGPTWPINISGTATPNSHTHDDRYYTETEVNTLLAGKQAAGSYAPSTGIAPSAITGTAVITTDSRLLPAGAIMPFAGQFYIPDGWAICNGQEISRTEYSSLFTVIGTTYGAGNGSTTFNVPDLRGYFIRGHGTNSDGTASGTFGQKQQDQFKSHSHTASVSIIGSSGLVNGASSVSNTTTGGSGTRITAVSQIGGLGVSASIGATGETETRPANIALTYCIKY